MKEIRCPAEYDLCHPRGLFLGGGISGCPPWQAVMVDLLKDTGLVLINPRRDNFDVTDPSMTEQQIRWEYKHLQSSVVWGRIFWFPCETLCPITLFELGKFIEKPDPLFVGCHPEYKRKADLFFQMKLSRPWNDKVYASLEEMAEAIKVGPGGYYLWNLPTKGA